MDYHVSGKRLDVRLKRDFNFLTARSIGRLAEEADEIHIDLARSKFVDSEAVILLHRLVTSGKHVRLCHPPPLLAEVLHILKLESVLNLDALTA